MQNFLSNWLQKPGTNPANPGGFNAVSLEPLKKEIRSACNKIANNQKEAKQMGIPDAQLIESELAIVSSLERFITQRSYNANHFEAALQQVVTQDDHFTLWMNHFRKRGLGILGGQREQPALAPAQFTEPSTTLQPERMAQPVQPDAWGQAEPVVAVQPVQPAAERSTVEPKPRGMDNPQSTMAQLTRPVKPVVVPQPAQPVQSAAITTAQPSEVATVDPGELVCHPDFYDDDVAIAEMANSALTSSCSQLVFGDRRTGRSTLVKTLLSLMFSKKRDLSCRVVTTQTENYLGLQASTNVVHYATGAASDMVVKANPPIKEVYDAMVKRLNDQESRLVSNKRPKKYAPFVLVLDCWSIIYDNWKSLTAADRKSKKVNDMVAQLKAIIQQGSTVGIMAILCGCSHSPTELGLTAATLASMALTATCLTTNQTGGVVAFQKILNDKNFLTEASRRALRKLLSKGLQLNTGLIVTFSGVPRMFFYGDFSDVIDNQRVEYAGLLMEKQ